eukprot:CAMPEP_0171912298 /NCGR_PEP_ID=MMETSP0993-20121228/10973_1 /TAXON_ID=483369 /ORGANISM="non described non described, Strain CCMP2098" /LENGTH=815 /DNA_ID=CAMNT_0012546069 /DNA_START=46 /DNA_END=2493 /DNA_ORIENTATION=+
MRVFLALLPLASAFRSQPVWHPKRHPLPRVQVHASASSSLNELLKPEPATKDGLRFVFVGGKGGVGKTTTTAALAVSLADAGFKTLVVSTDPAHSLGDALFLTPADGDLKGKGSTPTSVGGCNDLLDALEIDPDASIQKFKDALGAFDLAGAAREVGGQAGADFVDRLGLSDFVRILESPPPGVDELVALQEVLKLSREGNYDRVLIDTAPTGHTLRLLSAPDFLDKFLTKVGALRSRLDGVLGMGAGFLGIDVGQLTSKLDKATATLEGYRVGAVELKALFENAEATQFVAVASPTPLAVMETRRLIETLKAEKISVRHLVVNRVLPKAESSDGGGDGGGGVDAAASDATVLATMRRGQVAALQRATSEASPLGRTRFTTATNGMGVELTQVPLLDADICGVGGLRYLGAVAFQGRFESVDLLSEAGDQEAGGSNHQGSGPSTKEKWEDLLSECPGQRFVVVGGKGGVGKTSTSAALAVACAEQGGFSTVVVSTDPAHSLGDALGVKLQKGQLTPVSDVDTTGAMGGESGGCLYALEVDTDESVAEFKTLVQSLTSSSGSEGQGLLGRLNIGDFADVLDTAPPGLDELVALSKVLSLVQQQAGEGVRFDRVIIDTAPTGHTLRLLSFPRFLDDFLEKLIALRAKLKGASAVLNMFSGGGGSSQTDGGGGEAADAEGAKDRLREFQVRMYALEDLLTDPSKSEFVVVTVPTELAVAETERLVLALEEESIAVKHVVVNQVLRPQEDNPVPGAESYVERLRREQGKCVAQLRTIANEESKEVSPIDVTEVPWLDVEARSVYGLRVIGNFLLTAEAE